MTGKERGLAALRGEPHDRPPVIPIVGQAGGTLCGRTIYEHAHDPQLLAESRSNAPGALASTVSTSPLTRG